MFSLFAALSVVAAGAGSPAAAATAPASEWSVASSANRPAAETVDYLDDVACVSASDCWAVGYYSAGRYSGGVDLKTLIEHWDGTAWTVVKSPNADDLVHNYLTDVACVSASDCWAVGYYGNSTGSVKQQTLILRWDGAEWTKAGSPNTSVDEANLLHAVTCVSAWDCWAVGYHSTPTGAETLIERWNGSDWTIVASPNGVQLEPVASPFGSNVLYDVACGSTTSCWAVGNYYNGVANQTLIERWDGTAWSVVASMNANPASTNSLHGVTCPSVSDCWAVGSVSTDVASESLVQHWDGSLWTLDVPPTAPGNNGLYGVTCASSTECWAVGSHDIAGAIGQVAAGVASQTVIARWDGIRWAVVESPNTSASKPNVVSGVTCVAAAQCWAVGWAGGFAFETLTARWDGTSWTKVPSPNATAAADHFLRDVTCVSATDCWAVGQDHAGNARQHLIERWNGGGWSIVPSPTRSADHDHDLASVTCLSASDCWAVGHELTTGVAFQTLVQHFDGADWSIVPSPNTSADMHNALASVTCLSSADCWAVGYTGAWAGSARQTLTQHWNGTAWSIVSSPNADGVPISALADVTCVSTSACWAVGHAAAAGDGVHQTLAMRWDGTAWAIVSSPNGAGAPHSSLSSVTCVAAADCWAVGSSFSLDPLYLTHTDNRSLIERWDGTSWTIVGSSNPQDTLLSGVTCVSAAECWAVGSRSVDGELQTLIEQWNGTSWASGGAPNAAGSRDNALSAVACTAESCWAVGHRNVGLIAQTLTAQYGGFTADPVVPEAPYLPLLVVAGGGLAVAVTRRRAVRAG